jgi:hypothetical protein
MSHASEDRGITEEKEGAAPAKVSRSHGLESCWDGSNGYAYLSNAVARTFVSARCPCGRRSSSVRPAVAAATVTTAAL